MLGRSSEAAAQLGRAEALHPADPLMKFQRAALFADSGNWTAAAEKAREALAIRSDHALSRWILARCFEQLGNPAEAEKMYSGDLAIRPSDVRVLGSLGYLKAKHGDTSGAKDILARLDLLKRAGRPTLVAAALVHAGLGETSAALTALEGAAANRESGVLYTRLDSRFAGIAHEPRFKGITLPLGLENR
jgi:Flp pilus assembly protein TadD